MNEKFQMEVKQMKIENDEMVSCFQENLSDDLWDRYGDEEELTNEQDKFLEINPEKEWTDAENAKRLLISLWKEDIKKFRQNCKKLGYNNDEINKVCEEIIKEGLDYLEYDRKGYDSITPKN